MQGGRGTPTVGSGLVGSDKARKENSLYFRLHVRHLVGGCLPPGLNPPPPWVGKPKALPGVKRCPGAPCIDPSPAPGGV